MTRGRAGIGGRSRRRSGLLDALIDAGFVAAPRRTPRTWQALLAGLIVCDEVTPAMAGPLDDVQETTDAPPA